MVLRVQLRSIRPRHCRTGPGGAGLAPRCDRRTAGTIEGADLARWRLAGAVAVLCCSAYAAPAQTAPEAQRPGAGQPAPAPSQCDAGCVRANTERAVQACVPRIEAEAANDFDWILRPLPSIFQQADQASATDHVVRYRGDSIRFQGANRDWTRITYECGYDVEARTVMFVHVRPGRLDRPEVARAPQQQSVASTAARPAPRTVAPTFPPRPAAERGAGDAGGQVAAKKPAHPVVVVGEPSPVEILQQSPRVR